MPSPLYFNDETSWTIYDIAREIQIRAGKIRMLNPIDYNIKGKKLLEEIDQIILKYMVVGHG